MKLTNDEKRAAALQYLGTKHVLHAQYDGKHTVMPDAETDIGKLFKRIAKRATDEAKQQEAERIERISRTVTPFIGRGR